VLVRNTDSEALLSCDILAVVHVRSLSQSGLTNEVHVGITNVILF